MSQSKKRGTDSQSVEKAPSSKAIDRDPKGRRAGFIIASVVIALILIIVGIFYYQEYVVPFQRTIITVDDTSIRIDYFLKRTRLAGADPMLMLDELTNEQLIKIGAPRYGIEISPEDIDQTLRSIAGGESGTISDSEFKEWYRQQLNESGLSDTEYREIYIAIPLLAIRLQEYLAERIPTVAEQIHLHIILLETYEDAEEVRARWEAGEDFADLAREVSLDEGTGENGGDLGWLPRSVTVFDYVAFNISIGEVSVPLRITEEGGYYLLMVSEKTDAREVDENFLPILRSKVLDDWLLEEAQLHEISFNFNSELYAWLNWQLAKK